MSNDKPSNTDPLSGLALYQRFLKSAPVRFPLQPASIDQSGTLYRMKPQVEKKAFGKIKQGDVIPEFIVLGCGEKLMVAPFLYGMNEWDEQHTRGSHDVLITGAASPYAQPWNLMAGSIRVLYWLRQPVNRAVFEKTTRLAAMNAANITEILAIGDEPEGEITQRVQEHRDQWAPKWERAFQLIGG